MKRLAFLSALVSLFLLPGLSGCGFFEPAMFIKDKIPEGSAKGFVKFYYLKSEGDVPSYVYIYSTNKTDPRPGFRISMYSNEVPGWDYDAFLMSVWFKQDERGYLVAKTPGTYIIAIRFGSNAEPEFLKIRVQENMVTPIKFNFYSSSQRVSSSTTYYRHSATITVEKSFPFTSGGSKK